MSARRIGGSEGRGTQKGPTGRAFQPSDNPVGPSGRRAGPANTGAAARRTVGEESPSRLASPAGQTDAPPMSGGSSPLLRLDDVAEVVDERFTQHVADDVGHDEAAGPVVVEVPLERLRAQDDPAVAVTELGERGRSGVVPDVDRRPVGEILDALVACVLAVDLLPADLPRSARQGARSRCTTSGTASAPRLRAARCAPPGSTRRSIQGRTLPRRASRRTPRTGGSGPGFCRTRCRTSGAGRSAR